MGKKFHNRETLENHPCGEGEGNFHFSLFIILFMAFSICLKIPSLKFPHSEPDEIVYLSLAEKLIKKGEYNLKGTEILKILSPTMYDRELFNHPPLFPVLLIPFLICGWNKGTILLSWSGHLLCILGVGLFLNYIKLTQKERLNPLSNEIWIPIMGIAIDPMMNFVSRKIWMDGLLAGFITLSTAFFYGACRLRYSGFRFFLSGIFLGLASLMKISALVITPVFFYMLMALSNSLNYRIKAILWSALPFLILFTPWLVVFYRKYSVFFPYWAKPDVWTMEHYPFVLSAVERPFYYYAMKLYLIQPVVIILGYLYLTRFYDLRKVEFMIPFIWFFLYLGVFTLAGILKMGYQMRHLCPMYPSIYLMLYSHLARKEKGMGLIFIISIMAIFYAGLGGAIYLIDPRYDEILSFMELSFMKGGISL
jgi:hypothetical protein